ncbi:hypothetical protein HPB47_024107, partial [Ixodes persulcatus]
CGISLLTLCYTVISQNFLRYRTVASGISNAGVTLGSFLYPPLVQFFFDGTFLCPLVIYKEASDVKFLVAVNDNSHDNKRFFSNRRRIIMNQPAHVNMAMKLPPTAFGGASHRHLIY